jgi:hypothetical protein
MWFKIASGLLYYVLPTFGDIAVYLLIKTLVNRLIK